MSSVALIPGSLSQIAKRDGVSLAESFLNVDVVIVVDTSGSMEARDCYDGQQRYERALAELTRVQNDLAGKVAVVAFSDRAVFVPSGLPPLLGSSTNLAGALAFVRLADTGDIRFVIISDGQPDNAETALQEAAKIKGPLDTIFIGPEGDPGADFLRRLANVRGGQTAKATNALHLADHVERLMLAA